MRSRCFGKYSAKDIRSSEFCGFFFSFQLLECLPYSILKFISNIGFYFIFLTNFIVLSHCGVWLMTLILITSIRPLPAPTPFEISMEFFWMWFWGKYHSKLNINQLLSPFFHSFCLSCHHYKTSWCFSPWLRVCVFLCGISKISI